MSKDVRHWSEAKPMLAITTRAVKLPTYSTPEQTEEQTGVTKSLHL